MKNYELSIGQTLNENNINEFGDLELKVQWANWKVSAIFTRDDDDSEKADNAVALFERVYAKREYWLMLAYHQLKIKLIEDIGDDYEDYVDAYREVDSWNPPFSEMKYSFFNELLAEIELTHVFFGSEGELIFMFYDYSRECNLKVVGTESEKLTAVESNEDDWDD